MEKVYSGYELEVNKNVEDIAYNGRMLKIEGNSKQKIIEEVKGKEVTGEFITVNDVELEDGRIAVSGNSKQETREGYNLLNLENLTTITTQGVTVTNNKDGSFTLNGTSINSYGFTVPINNPKTLKANTDYTIRTTHSGSATSYSGSLIGLREEEGTNLITKNFTDGKTTYTPTEDVTINYTRIYFDGGVTFTNLTIYPMLYQGTEEREYEQYGASPSPEYSSEVESCGDNVNLFDGILEEGNINSDNGSDETVTSQAMRSKNYIEVSANTIYTLSNFTGDLNTSSSSRFIEYDEDKKFIKVTWLVQTNSQWTITTSSTTKYVRFTQIQNIRNLSSQIKLEKGSKSTGHSKYGQGCINEVICNKNWIDKNKFARKGLSSGSVGAEINKISSTTRLLLDEEIISKPNATYSFSLGTSKSLRYNIFEIDENNIILKVHAITSNANTTFTTLENTRKINIMILWQTTTNEITLDAIANCNIQLEKGTKTDYIKAQSQTYTIPTQQPFRAIGDVRDTFAKKNNKWFERHNIQRIIFDGTEDWLLGKAGDNYTKFYCRTTYPGTSARENLLCSHFIYGAVNNLDKNCIQPYTYETYYGINIAIANDIANDVISFKSWLAEQYEAGTPVYVDYVLAEPTDIECTEEQEIILEKIQNIKLYDGINYIYSLDDIEALLTFEYYYKMKDYDFYLSADGYLNIPSLGIRYLVDLNESSISTMPEAVESSVRVAGRDGDVVLNTTYEPIPFNIVCYTEDNLTAMEKTEQEIKINSFLNSIKNRTKRFAIERNTKFYEVKYNGALTTINFPKFLKFSIPFKSSDSYGKDIVENIMIGNEKVNSNTIKEVGALITIKGPAISPIIALNDYSIEYSTDIIDGARIEIDTNKSTVTHINSDEVKTNVMKYYNHQFPKIENGENELKILSGIDDNNRVNIKWNDLKL